MSRNRNVGKHIDTSTLVPQIELFGDWDKTRYVLSTLEATVKIGVEKGKKSAAEKIKTAIRRNIRENGGSLNWPAVSTKYAAYKTKKGYDPENLLRMTNLYYNSIKVWKKGSNYYVGVLKNTRHDGKDITVGQIANILEKGSHVRNIPPRPLWVPTFKQFGGNNRVKGLILWHVRNEIYKKYGIRPKLTL